MVPLPQLCYWMIKGLSKTCGRVGCLLGELNASAACGAGAEEGKRLFLLSPRSRSGSSCHLGWAAAEGTRKLGFGFGGRVDVTVLPPASSSRANRSAKHHFLVSEGTLFSDTATLAKCLLLSFCFAASETRRGISSAEVSSGSQDLPRSGRPPFRLVLSPSSLEAASSGAARSWVAFAERPGQR